MPRVVEWLGGLKEWEVVGCQWLGGGAAVEGRVKSDDGAAVIDGWGEMCCGMAEWECMTQWWGKCGR